MSGTNYDLSRINVLIVDDCGFAIKTLSNVLRILKVGKLYSARDGAEAVEVMKKSLEDSAVHGQSNIDIIICDWMMEPVGGDMFLRWVRRSSDSPDRYIPFVAMSGVVDEKTIGAARDLGVTEFLAKPFSMNTVSKHLVSVIDRPRQFIFNGEYFGPDRRRRKLNINFDDRRIMNPANVEVVYSGKKPESLDTKAKVWHFRLPNGLKGKFSGAPSGEGGRIDPDLLEAAEQQLESMEDDYTDWVKTSIDGMIAHYEALKENPVNPWRHLKEINKTALHLRGQGGTFGYDLITAFGKSLYECTLSKREVTDNLLEFIKTHFDAITAVLRDKTRGSGGRVGEELLKMLDKAREKYGQDDDAASKK